MILQRNGMTCEITLVCFCELLCNQFLRSEELPWSKGNYGFGFLLRHIWSRFARWWLKASCQRVKVKRHFLLPTAACKPPLTYTVPIPSSSSLPIYCWRRPTWVRDEQQKWFFCSNYTVFFFLSDNFICTNGFICVLACWFSGLGNLAVVAELLSQAEWAVLKNPELGASIQQQLHRSLGQFYTTTGNLETALFHFANDVWIFKNIFLLLQMKWLVSPYT